MVSFQIPNLFKYDGYFYKAVSYVGNSSHDFPSSEPFFAKQVELKRLSITEFFSCTKHALQELVIIFVLFLYLLSALFFQINVSQSWGIIASIFIIIMPLIYEVIEVRKAVRIALKRKKTELLRSDIKSSDNPDNIPLNGSVELANMKDV